MTELQQQIEPDWPRNVKHFGVIDSDVLALLTSLRGRAEPGGVSPATLWPPPARGLSDPMRQMLAERGVLTSPRGTLTLTEAFADAADVLLAPRTTVNLRAWSEDGWQRTSVLMPANIPRGEGVALIPVGDDAYSLAAPVAPDDLWSILQASFLGAVAEREAVTFEAHVTPGLAGALLGIVDLARREELKRLAWATPLAPLKFPTAEVVDFALSQWGISGLEQLLTAAVVAGAWGQPPDAEEIITGLTSLVDAGLLTQAGEDIELGPDACDLVRRTLIIERGLQWQRVSLVEPGELALTSRIVIAAGGSNLLAFDRSICGAVLVRAITRDDLIEYLANEMTAELRLLAKAHSG